MKNKDIEKSLKRAVNQAPSLDFERLANTTVVKMTEHDYITTQEIKSKPKFHKQFSGAFAFGIIMLMFVSGWFVQYRMPDSVIALDVNPSIEITTSRHNTVLSIKAVNKDAQKVIDGHDYVNSDLNSTVESLCKSMISQGYLNNNKNVIMVSVENGDTDKAANQAKLVGEVIRKNVASQNITPHILRQVLDKAETEEKSALAEKYNVSIGKISLITEIASSDEKLTVEELSDMSIKDIITTCQEKSIDLHEIIESDEKELLPGNTDSNSGNGAGDSVKPSETPDSTNSSQGVVNQDQGSGNTDNTSSTGSDQGAVTNPGTEDGGTITIPDPGAANGGTDNTGNSGTGNNGDGANENNGGNEDTTDTPDENETGNSSGGSSETGGDNPTDTMDNTTSQ